MKNMKAIFRSPTRIRHIKQSYDTIYRCCSTKKVDDVRTFSGIQPTGSIHLGNYLGAVKSWVDGVAMSSKEARDQNLFSIVNLHAITLPQNPSMLDANTYSMAASLIACGLQPDKCILFRQSTVQEHTQLCWILACISTTQALSRLSQYKDKSANMKETPLGLYLYPVLQAADILLYKGKKVPVGEDNLQNIELSRRLARSFNNRYCKQTDPIFPIPTPVLVGGDTDEGAARVKSLRDPSKKMSKSDPDSKSCIYINDTPKDILEKCKKALTDFTSEVTYDPANRPGVANLINIHSALTGISPEDICIDSKGIETSKYKVHLAELLIEHLTPIREHSEYLINNKDHLESVLKIGEDTAKNIARQTMKEVANAVGLN